MNIYLRDGLCSDTQSSMFLIANHGVLPLATVPVCVFAEGGVAGVIGSLLLQIKLTLCRKTCKKLHYNYRSSSYFIKVAS